MFGAVARAPGGQAAGEAETGAPANAAQGSQVPADSESVASEAAEVAPPDFAIPKRGSLPAFAAGPVASRQEEPQRHYVESTKRMFGATGVSNVVRELRADIKSATIVTDLVAAMASRPGSGAEPLAKQRVLTQILALARRSAAALAQQMEPERADLAWVQKQALSMTARILARQWEQDDPETSFEEFKDRHEETMAMVTALLSDEEGLIAEAIDVAAQGDHFKKVETPQSAADHRMVSIHAAAWTLASVVASVRQQDGEVFSFGMPVDAVVQALAHKTLEIVIVSKPEISDPDAAVTYWNGAMRRACQLISAEYKTKAKETLGWVDAAKADERAKRIAECADIFERQAIPFIQEWGTKNFQSIERAAKKLIAEDVHDAQKSQDRHSR